MVIPMIPLWCISYHRVPIDSYPIKGLPYCSRIMLVKLSLFSCIGGRRSLEQVALIGIGMFHPLILMMASQILLLFIYIDVMSTLVNEVLGDPISGVVILIYGIPITGLYIIIAGVALFLGLSLEYAAGGFRKKVSPVPESNPFLSMHSPSHQNASSHMNDTRSLLFSLCLSCIIVFILGVWYLEIKDEILGQVFG